MGHCKTEKQAPNSKNRLEAVYCDVVQQLDQHLQLQSLRKTAKGWMRLHRSNKPADAVHSETSPTWLSTLLPKHHRHDHRHDHRPGLQPSSVNLECQAFPKYWSQNVVDMGSRRSARKCRKPSDSASNKVKGLGNERGNESRRSESPSQVTRWSGSEIGRFRKSIESTTTNSSSSKSRTTVGCENLAITRLSSNPSRKAKAKRQSQLLKPVETECSSSSSSTFFQVRNNLQCNSTSDDDPRPPLVDKPERRPANMMLRRQFNCESLMEEVKTQRVLSNARKREPGLNAMKRQAPVAIVILRSSNRTSVSKESRTQVIRNEDTSQTFRHFGRCSENYEGCNEATRASDQTGGERPNARAMLESPVAQKCRPIATADRATAILQDALKALECAHRWNEWGARTLQELAKASKAATEQQKFLLDWARLSEKPEILLPHDNDVTVCTRRGRVLECREEEREFIRDLIMVSGVTNGENSLLNARQHVVNRKTIRRKLIANSESISFEKSRTSKKKLVEKRLLCDFVQELLRHELELRKCAQLEINLIHEHERQGQALMQRVWNHLQICPIPASDDVCTTVGGILQRDLLSQGLGFRVEMAEVTEELEKLIYEDVMQELLRELTTVKLK